MSLDMIGADGWKCSDNDKTRQELHGKQGHTSRIQQQQKKCLSLLELNSSQRDSALCNAVLAQSGTDVMAPLIP